jgi:hypothetical protein
MIGQSGARVVRIVEFWSKCLLEKPPFVHPEDRGALNDGGPRLDFEGFIRSERFGDLEDQDFHPSLIPVPYVGDLERADVFLLTLNPGCEVSDYYAEYCVPEFRRRLKATLRQELARVSSPFWCLDPELCWHGGYRYWEGKLRQVALEIATEKFNGCYLDALKELSRRVAVLQLVPYHSRSFGSVKDLASTREAQHFAKELANRAREGRATMIVLRAREQWRLRGGRNVVVYAASLARASSLGPTTRGGKAILKRILG